MNACKFLTLVVADDPLCRPLLNHGKVLQGRKKVNIRVAVILIYGIAISGCATTPIPNTAAKIAPASQIIDNSYLKPGPGLIEVTVKRDSGIFGSACSSRIYVDGKPVADINVSEKIVLYLTKDEHILGAWPNGICGGGMSEVRADLRSGSPANFRVGYGSNGDFFINQTAF